MSEMDVLRLRDVDASEPSRLLLRYELRLAHVDTDAFIPGSYWGEPEAGLIQNRLFARLDTPLHSILHEASHFACMTPARREKLHRDAGGHDGEEDAVCYLQVLLSECLACISRPRLFRDMDAWGYSFRLGSTARWFYEDSEDAVGWLRREGLIDDRRKPTWVRRGESRLRGEQSRKRVSLVVGQLDTQRRVR